MNFQLHCSERNGTQMTKKLIYCADHRFGLCPTICFHIFFTSGNNFYFFTFGSTPLCTTFIGLNLGFHAESQTPMLSLLFILLQGFFLLEACCQTSRGASGVQGWLHWRTLNFLSLQHQRLMSLSPFLLQDVVPSKDQRIRLLYVTWYLSL